MFTNNFSSISYGGNQKAIGEFEQRNKRLAGCPFTMDVVSQLGAAPIAKCGSIE